MNAYEQKQEDKRERLLNAADRAEARSNAAYGRADLREEASGIPLGQPILVGHHSEGRHRAAIKRADNAMRKSIDEGKRAADLRAKAAGVGTGGISSDDPEAVVKLQAKIDTAEQSQDFMKRSNKIVRAAVKKGIEGPDSEGWETYFADLRNIPHGEKYSEAAAVELLAPDFCGRIGFASYQLTNNNANISRMKKRLEGLKAKEGAETKRETLQGFCDIVQNVEENRIQFIFEGKPSAEIRAIMKGHGFRWAPSQGAWQRQLTNNAKYSARLVVKQLNALA